MVFAIEPFLLFSPKTPVKDVLSGFNVTSPTGRLFLSMSSQLISGPKNCVSRVTVKPTIVLRESSNYATIPSYTNGKYLRLADTFRDTGVFSWAQNYRNSTGRTNWHCGPGGSRRAEAADRPSRCGARKTGSVSRPTTGGRSGCLR